MSNFMNNGILSSSTITAKAGAALTDPRGRALKFDENGCVVLADTAGEFVAGIGLLMMDVEVEAGKDVDIQVQDFGYAYAGADIKRGEALAVDATGALVPAASGNFIVGVAHEDATADHFFRVRVCMMGYMAAAAAAGGMEAEEIGPDDVITE